MGRPFGLVVAIVLLVALGLTWAPSSRGDDPPGKSLEERLEEANRRLAQVQGELDRVKAERDALADGLRAAKAHDDLLLKEVAALRQTIRETMNKRDENVARLVETTDKLRQAQTELSRLRERLRIAKPLAGTVLNAEKDDAVEISIGARDGVRKRMSLVVSRAADGKPVTVGLLLVTEVKTETSICKTESLGTEKKVQNGDRVEEWLGTPSSFTGLVLAVKENGHIEISIGSDDGVMRGDKLRVIQADGSVYLGQVEVIETRDNRAVGRIVEGTLRGFIHKGDRVTTSRSDVLTRE